MEKTGLDERKPVDKAKIAELVRSLKKTHKLPKDKIIGEQFVQSLFNDVKIPGYNGGVNEQNLPHGHGTLRLPDGSIYEGDFIQGKMEGHGKITRVTEHGQFPEYTLEGTFQDGKPLKGTYVAYTPAGYTSDPSDLSGRVNFLRTGSNKSYTFEGSFTAFESHNPPKFSGVGKKIYDQVLHIGDSENTAERLVIKDSVGIKVVAERIVITSEEGTFVNSKLVGEGTRFYCTNPKSNADVKPDVEIRGFFDEGSLRNAFEGNKI